MRFGGGVGEVVDFGFSLISTFFKYGCCFGGGVGEVVDFVFSLISTGLVGEVVDFVFSLISTGFRFGFGEDGFAELFFSDSRFSFNCSENDFGFDFVSGFVELVFEGGMGGGGGGLFVGDDGGFFVGVGMGGGGGACFFVGDDGVLLVEGDDEVVDVGTL